MFQKNHLTTILNNLLIKERTAVVLKTGNSWQKSFVSKTVYLLECVRVVVRQLAPIPKGIFFVFQNNQNNYVQLSTKRKKTSSEKLVNKKLKSGHWKTIKQIISEILNLVKEKFVILKFAENKAKKREFTNEDLKLIQNLLEKNQGNFPNAWAEFYQITGTNKNTFNN